MVDVIECKNNFEFSIILLSPLIRQNKQVGTGRPKQKGTEFDRQVSGLRQLEKMLTISKNGNLDGGKKSVGLNVLTDSRFVLFLKLSQPENVNREKTIKLFIEC